MAKETKKMSGPIPWEKDDEKYPKRYAHCRLCNRYGEMKLAWDLQGYLCLHSGKCISRKFRKEDDNPTLEEELE